LNSQDGIDAAVAGDLVLVAPGTYVENIDFSGKAITLRSDVDGNPITEDISPETTTISGDPEISWAAVLFISDETEDAGLNGFTITNGDTIGDGGGIYCSHNWWPTITNCTISNNNAVDYGGGIYCSFNSTPMVANCILWGDSAREGPEIWIGTLSDSSTLTISYSDVEGGEEAVYKEPGCTLNWLEGNLDTDPLFVIGELGDFYLSQIAAGQAEDSPCIDAGFGPAEEIGGSTRTDHVGDIGTVDMGYHYHPLECTDSDEDCFAIEGGDCGSVDCDDSDPAVNPGTEESDEAGNCADGKDNDCDGLTDLYDPDCGECDVDGDGYEAEMCGGDDCDDIDPVVYPGAEEICASGIDDDCAGFVDSDDQDCITDFVLELDAYYEATTLHLGFTIGTPGSATWSNYLVLTYSGLIFTPLWTVPLPEIDPPFYLPISFSLPSVGWIGILSSLLPTGEQPIVELVWIDTGDDPF